MTSRLLFSNLLRRLLSLTKRAACLIVQIGYRTKARALMLACLVTRSFQLYDIKFFAITQNFILLEKFVYNLFNFYISEGLLATTKSIQSKVLVIKGLIPFNTQLQ